MSFQKLNGTAGKIETIKAGKIHVDFTTTDNGNFRVQVTPEKWMRVFATLKKEQAQELGKPMKRAVRAAALVDRKVRF